MMWFHACFGTVARVILLPSAPSISSSLTWCLGRLSERTPRLIVLADTPRLGYDPAECLASSEDISECAADRATMVDEAYRQLESDAAEQAGAELLSATEWLCFEDDCPLVRGPYLVFRDRHHLTATFATRLAERVGASIDAPAE
jgi:hypothetical protein